MTSQVEFAKFTERARKVLTLAQEEAQRFNHNYIGTEHFLLGLVREGGGVACTVLRMHDIDMHKVRSAVEFIIGRGERQVTGNIGLTPRSKKVVELAVDEAYRLDHHYIGTEHFLLGLLREGEGIAAGVLESLGLDLNTLRMDVIAVVTGTDRNKEKKTFKTDDFRNDVVSAQQIDQALSTVLKQANTEKRESSHISDPMEFTFVEAILDHLNKRYKTTTEDMLNAQSWERYQTLKQNRQTFTEVIQWITTEEKRRGTAS